jgi:uncharacterized protein (DUF488 family)
MEIYTTGFTKKTAAEFFGPLKRAGIQRLIDIRLNNSSQLSGFAKKSDLPFFLKEICQIEYQYEPLLAPTQEILDEYKKYDGSWSEYAQAFLDLMKKRKIEAQIQRQRFEVPAVLLCSEYTPDCCHRRLVAEYLRDAWDNVKIIHL